MSLIIFIALLVALILVHELGHFVVAKLFGIRVDEFGIFFPPRLFAWKKGGTEYSINWLPFGGFVKIFGENAQEGAGDPRSFASKPRPVQAAVILAGVVMNILFAWFILSAGYMVGLPTSTSHNGFGEVRDARTTIVNVFAGLPADKSGVKAGDVIEHVATAYATAPPYATGDQIQTFTAAHQDESIILTVLRDGEEKTFILRGVEGGIAGRKLLGIQMDEVGVLKLPPHLALLQGAVVTYRMTVATAEGLAVFVANIFRGNANFADVAGPIGIANIGANAVSDGFAAAITLTALISINLAIINLIPIPGLDGGRLLIIGVEGIIRRPISQRFIFPLTIAGFALLILLMIVVSYHDIARLIG